MLDQVTTHGTTLQTVEEEEEFAGPPLSPPQSTEMSPNQSANDEKTYSQSLYTDASGPPAKSDEYVADINRTKRNEGTMRLPIGADERVEYRRDLFVEDDRKSLLDTVTERATELCQKGIDDAGKRIMVIHGEVGTGKSWFLQHCKELLKEQMGRQLFLFEFNLLNRNHLKSDYEPTTTLLSLLLGFADALSPDGSQQLTSIVLPELSRQIMEQLHRLLRTRCAVIVIDEVFEADWNLLEIFEEYLLGPLAIESKVMILMAGRGRRFPWVTQELRFHADYRELEPFGAMATKKQLSYYPNTNIQQVDEVLKISQGVPLISDLVARWQNANPTARLTDPSLFLAVIEQILSRMEEDKRQTTSQQLEALSVLRAFDDDRIQALVGARQGTEVSLKESVAIRREFVHEALAYYDREQGAYVIDEFLQKFFLTYLQLDENRTLWCSLNRVAAELYQTWLNKYSRGSERWQKELEFHSHQLKVANCS